MPTPRNRKPKHRKSTPSTPAVPGYLFHKATGQGYARMNGRQVYFGDYDKPESKQKYYALIARYLKNNGTIPPAPPEITIMELCALYLKFASSRYVNSEGEPTQTMDWVRAVIKTLREMFGYEQVPEFGPLKLQDCLDTWIKRKLTRRTCNAYLAQTKRLFKYAASQELITGDVYQALKAVESLQRGRTAARETPKVKPVPEPDIEAVRPYLSRQINALITVQLYSGARGGELLGLRPCDIDTSGEVWIGRPVSHKLAYRGMECPIAFGPQCQEALREFMLRSSKSYLFSPRDAEEGRHAQASNHRRPDQKPGNPKTDRKLGERYTNDSYRRAIKRACDVAGVKRWTPHQLRHNAATRAREEHGLEGGRVHLRQACINTTKIYAEGDLVESIEIAKKIG